MATKNGGGKTGRLEPGQMDELLPDQVVVSPEQVVEILRAMGHPIRYRIMQLLADKEQFGLADPSCCERQEVCVCRIGELFDITASTLSHHLKLLREAGLIESRRQGVWIYYTIRPETVAALLAALTLLEPRGEA
jgi:ArsR family transcriptional regulator